MIRETTVWERLAEFRARNRVRLVTLWETGGNSLSLQAGRKGDPTLQWTSRLSTHAGATGLLDELFSTSVGGVGGAVGRSLHLSPHSSSAEAGSKSGKSQDAGLAGLGGGPTR